MRRSSQNRSKTDIKATEASSKSSLKKKDRVPRSVGHNYSAIEGWILLVSGVHEEAEEDMVYDLFSKFGPIKNLRLPLDRQTGLIKGYALIEYEDYNQAKKAIEELNGHTMFEKKLEIGWAFKKNPADS